MKGKRRGPTNVPINFEDEHLEIFTNAVGGVFVKDKKTGASMEISSNPDGGGIRINTSNLIEPILVTPQEKTWLVTPRPKKGAQAR